MNFLNDAFVAGLIGGGLAQGGVRLVTLLIKALLGELKKKALKTPTELDDLALQTVETVVDQTAPVLEKTLGKK